jgi:hypothetical protein
MATLVILRCPISPAGSSTARIWRGDSLYHDGAVCRWYLADYAISALV